MNRTYKVLVLAAGLLAAAVSFADAPPADAPAGTTGLCKDGTYSSADKKKGACAGHKGVKSWYAAGAAASGTTPPAMTKAPAAMPAATPAAAPAAAATAGTMAKTSTTAMTPKAVAAPGGGPGMVWANTGGSKVYHCSGDKWYGKTKAGQYMSEADAKAQGFHADHGKACS
jgi:hypothetical protein